MRFLGYVIRMSCVTCLAELFVIYGIYPIEARFPFAFMHVLLGLFLLPSNTVHLHESCFQGRTMSLSI